MSSNTKKSKSDGNYDSTRKPSSSTGSSSYHPYAPGSSASDASFNNNNHGKSQIYSNNVDDSKPSTNYRGRDDDYQQVSHEESDSFTMCQRQQDNMTMQTDDVYQNSETWNYGCTSNMKSLEKIGEAHSYVEGLAKIWQVPHTMEGESFVADLHQAIDDGTKEYCREYVIKDEKKTKSYVVVGVRSLRGQRRDIFHCVQHLTVVPMNNVGRGENVVLNIAPSIRWFRMKAKERLQFHGNVIQASHTSSFDRADGHYQNNTGTDMYSNQAPSGPCRLS